MTSPAFEQLLAALDPDRERAGLEYRELHHRLVKFFEWQCTRQPDEQADRVIDRIIHKIEQGERFTNLRAYAYGVAKLVLREAWKEAVREEAARAQLLHMVRSSEADVVLHPAEDVDSGQEQECLEKCLASLPAKNREIILAYYSDEQRGRIGRRRELAAQLGSDLNALRVRAHRIRTQLEACVWGCLGRPGGGGS